VASTLYVTEYAKIASDANGNFAMGQEPPLADYTVAFGSSSPAFNVATRFVRLHADSICSVLLGTNPSAATTNGRMAANQTEYRAVPQGSNFKVSVVTNT